MHRSLTKRSRHRRYRQVGRALAFGLCWLAGIAGASAQEGDAAPIATDHQGGTTMDHRHRHRSVASRTDDPRPAGRQHPGARRCDQERREPHRQDPAHAPGVNSRERSVYPGFWARDPAWLAEAGLASPEVVWGWVELLCATMNGVAERVMTTGAVVPPFAVADHVTLKGEAIFFPASQPGDGQGGGIKGRSWTTDLGVVFVISGCCQMSWTAEPICVDVDTGKILWQRIRQIQKGNGRETPDCTIITSSPKGRS